MTEEEIKQKAEEYAEKVISTDDGYYEWNDLIYMFRKGAKLIQKENDRLAKHILELQKDKGELTDKIADIKANCDFVLEGKDVEIKELRDNYEQYKAVAEPTIKELQEKIRTDNSDVIANACKKIAELEKENEQAKEIIKHLLWDLRNKDFDPAKDIEKAEHFLGRDACQI